MKEELFKYSNLIPEKNFKGWILYDGMCGFCKKFIFFWRSTLLKKGFDIAALQEDWVVKQLNMSADEAEKDFRLLLKEQIIYSGAEAYRYILGKIWWAWPLYILSVLPLTRNIFDWCYRAFANNRHKISKTCGLAEK